MAICLASRLSTLVTVAVVASGCSTSPNLLSVATTGPAPSAAPPALSPQVPSATLDPTLTPAATIGPAPSATPPTLRRQSAVSNLAITSASTLAPASAATPTQHAGSIPADLVPTLALIEHQISTIRGLELREPLAQRIGSAAQLRELMIDDIAQNYSRKQATLDAQLYWLLRIGTRDVDLYTIQIEFYGTNVAGYYDFDKKEILLLGDSKAFGPWERSVYAHELVHALQDQHYDLATLLDDSHEGDERLARQALVEGDAMLAEGAYYWQHLSDDERQAIARLAEQFDTSSRDHTPAYLVEAFDFPYTAGVDFVMALWKEAGWAGVNAALADPPVSSEQILHPEKYLDTPRDLPLKVTVPDLASVLGAGWSEVDSDTLGEFDLRFLLKANSAYLPEQAAAGWGGARYRMWQHRSDALILVETRWDSELDASEFAEALYQTLDDADTAGELFVDAGRYIAVIEGGSQVHLISGTDRKTVGQALLALRPAPHPSR